MANWWDEYPDAEAPAASAAPAAVPAASGGENWWKGFPDAPVAPYSPYVVTPDGKPTLSTLITGQVPIDKYRQAAIEDRNRFIQAGAENVLPEGYTSRLTKGVGLNWTDELMAGALAPIEAMKRGLGKEPAWDALKEGYNYAKAAQDLSAEKAAENTKGVGGAAAEVLGGLATGAGAFGGTRAAAIGIPFTERAIPAGVVNYGRNVLKGGAIGGAAGAGEGNTFDERFRGAGIGGVLGAGIGAALPAITGVAGMTGRILQTPRLRDPENIATEQIAKAYRDSGESLPDIVQRVENAHAAGQPDYMFADALGKEGQRMLAAQAKVPGEPRDRIAEVLSNRLENRPYNVINQLGQALGSPTTAKQAQAALTETARAESKPLYDIAEKQLTWSPKIGNLLNNPDAQSGLKHGLRIQRLEADAEGRPLDPTDPAITGFNEAGDPIITGVPNMRTLQAVKIGLDHKIGENTDSLTGRVTPEGRALIKFRNSLLDEMISNNPAYGQANAAFGGPMRISDAVDVGRSMVTRGSSRDTVPAFQALPEAEKQGVRIGYADKAMEQVGRGQGNLPTILKGNVLKGNEELNALSLYQGPRQTDPLTGRLRPDQLRQYLNRVEEMQKTEKAALGGSSTAENLADITSAPGGAELVGAVGAAAHGNLLGAARNAYEVLLRVGKGESEKQRSAIAQMLMAREPADVQTVAERIAAHNLRRSGYNPWTGNVRYPEGQ